MKTTKEVKKYNRVRTIQILFTALLSIAVMMMPLAEMLEYERKISTGYYMTGVIFWIGFLGNLLVVIWLGIKRDRDGRFRMKYRRKKKKGRLHFLVRTRTKALDIMIVVLFITLILICIWKLEWQILFFVNLGMLIFTTRLHCIYNGVNYIYLKYKEEANE